MPPKPAKRNKHAAAVVPQSEHEAGPPSGPAFLRQTRTFASAVEITRARTFVGPIPPPELLADYEHTLPGLADRLVVIAERESEHRRALQRRVVRLSEWGLVAGFAIGMTALLGGLYLVHEGSEVEGMGSIILAIASLVLVFLTRGKRPPAERAEAAER